MANVNSKDLPAKYQLFGQYQTPDHIVDFCLSKTKYETDIVIEPSCGTGAFLNKLPNAIGLEIDPEICPPNAQNMNFYDFDQKFEKDLTFIGNPPYRTPAASLIDRKEVVHGLMKKYNITGMREEAVFFLVKTVDLILTNNVRGHIYYILPKSIFHNNSKSYQSFIKFLERIALLEVWDLPADFDKVNTDVCYVHFSVGYGHENQIKDFYGVNEEIITFHQIFKKTYLGSVPCESVLLSIRGEPLSHFKERLFRLMTEEDSKWLTYQGEFHLVALKKQDPKKIEVVWNNVKEIKRLVSVEDFLNDEYYKPIRHRKEDRWYFRHNSLKKSKQFVYQLNPNPCRSFYFPGNPVKGCLDYWGICEYDINRNCSPSANRTVPLDVDNITDEFKSYWSKTGLPLEKVFDYLAFVLASDWYKNMKSKYQRFYFGVPHVFDERFLCDSSSCFLSPQLTQT